MGTPAFMRVPAPLAIGDRRGTSGDGGATMPLNNEVVAATGGSPPGPCPQVSPLCPRHPEARQLNEIKLSPVSPVVPGIAGTNASGEDFDREAFEERAAIMEFDGGLTRGEAEAVAQALLGVAG